METAKYKLFKQSITVAGDWEESQSYDRLVIVTKAFDDGIVNVYISKKPVLAGTDIKSTEYWHRIGGFDEDTVTEFRNKLHSISSIIGTTPEEISSTLWDEVYRLLNKVDVLETDCVTYKGEITPESFTPKQLADKENGLYIFINAEATRRSFGQAEDFEHYNQRGIETGEVVDKGSYVIPADCRDLFKWHSLRNDFDWTIETGDVLLKTKDGWDIIASEDTKDSGSEGGEHYPFVPITPSKDNPNRYILDDDKYFEIGTEEVYVNGVRYFHDDEAYSYLDEGETISNGIEFSDELMIDDTDFVKLSAKIIN